MRPNHSWKFLLLWTALAFEASCYCITVDAAFATSLTQSENKTHIPSNILLFNVTEVAYRPLTETEAELGRFPKSQTQKLQKDVFSLMAEDSLQISSSESLDLHSQAVPNLKLIQPQYLQVKPNEIEKLPTVIAAEVNNPPPPNNPQNNPPPLNNPQNNPPPRDNPQNNLQKPNDPPQLEGQPSDFTNPTPTQIEQRLEDPKADYAKRLERLLQRLKENKEASNNLPNGELGTIIVKPLVTYSDSELGDLTVKPIEQQPQTPPTLQQPTTSKPIGYLFGHISYFQTNNVFSSAINPIKDGLIFSGITLASAPLALGSKTYLSGSIDGSVISYINQGIFNYYQFRVSTDLYHQITQRMYGEVGWSNQQLFYARNSDLYRFAAGDRFLNENLYHLALGRKDPLTPKLILDSYYELRAAIAEIPLNRNRINNSLWVSLSYYLQQSLNIGLDYQFNLSDFTERDRQDLYHRLFSHLNYKVSDIGNVSFQGGITLGSSTDNTINFNGWFFSLNYNWELGRF